MKILKWMGAVFVFLVGFMAVRKMTKFSRRANALHNKAIANAAFATDESLREAKVLQRKADIAKEEAKTALAKMQDRREQLKEQGNESLASKLDSLNKL